MIFAELSCFDISRIVKYFNHNKERCLNAVWDIGHEYTDLYYFFKSLIVALQNDILKYRGSSFHIFVD